MEWLLGDGLQDCRLVPHKGQEAKVRAKTESERLAERKTRGPITMEQRDWYARGLDAAARIASKRQREWEVLHQEYRARRDFAGSLPWTAHMCEARWQAARCHAKARDVRGK